MSSLCAHQRFAVQLDNKFYKDSYPLLPTVSRALSKTLGQISLQIIPFQWSPLGFKVGMYTLGYCEIVTYYRIINRLKLK